jgi:hypothetical protein
LEKRLVAVEQAHGPRLRAEEALTAFLRQFDPPPAAAGIQTAADDAKMVQLRALLEDAHFQGADEGLLSEALDILEKAQSFKTSRRVLDGNLRDALARHVFTELDLEKLEDAIADAKPYGISTLHAERELSRLRDARVGVQSAEAELQEAAKGSGPQGRKRLEQAVQAAKRVGVSPEKLKVAHTRLAELEGHEKRCELAAGSLRRVIPLLDTEPWQFEEHMRRVRNLMQPWTPELQREVKLAEETMQKVTESRTQRRVIGEKLREFLRLLEKRRATDGTGAGATTSGSAPGLVVDASSRAALARLLERARGAGVEEDVINEAEKQLKMLRREISDRGVAERRLRMAMNVKDLGEIERSIRQVRELSQHPAASGGGGADGASGRSEQPRSARLMETANAMLRQLNDANCRKEAAVTLLQERISDGGRSGQMDASHPVVAAGLKLVEKPQVAEVEAWIKDVKEAVQEAKQSGVAPSLISHAKLKIRERRREVQEHVQAHEALQRSLARKGAPIQEVLRDLKRLQRVQSQQRFD